MIQIATEDLPPRCLHGATALSSQEILIMGGYFGGRDLKDIRIFNLDDHSVRQVAKENEMNIVPANYPCKVPRDGIIVTAHDEISKLIEFDVRRD